MSLAWPWSGRGLLLGPVLLEVLDLRWVLQKSLTWVEVPNLCLVLQMFELTFFLMTLFNKKKNGLNVNPNNSLLQHFSKLC